MEEKIVFEYSLYKDGTPDHIIEIDDIDFVISTLVNLSIFRPQKYELIFELHRKYSERKGFREKFLARALKMNSNFVRILIDKSIYSSDDIANLQSMIDRFIDLSNKMDYVQNDICQNTLDLSLKLIETSFSPGSIEYCLKYDDIDEIHRKYQNPSFFQDKANIIEIENIMNLDFDLLGFCGFFGSVKCFKFFLEIKLFTIDQSVIECVICGGSIEIFRLCLQAVEILGNSFKLIILASCYNNLDLLHYFHDNGAEIIAKDNNDWTPLHYTACYGHLSVVEYLVNQKADINAKNEDNQTPLHLAAENGHLHVVEYLVNQKADINAKTNDDWTPLHYAARDGHLSVVEYLVNQKTDINTKDNRVEFLDLIRLLFILLLKKVILVLLNI